MGIFREMESRWDSPDTFVHNAHVMIARKQSGDISQTKCSSRIGNVIKLPVNYIFHFAHLLPLSPPVTAFRFNSICEVSQRGEWRPCRAPFSFNFTFLNSISAQMTMLLPFKIYKAVLFIVSDQRNIRMQWDANSTFFDFLAHSRTIITIIIIIITTINNCDWEWALTYQMYGNNNK